jgi:hypothetical protein
LLICEFIIYIFVNFDARKSKSNPHVYANIIHITYFNVFLCNVSYFDTKLLGVIIFNPRVKETQMSKNARVPVYKKSII